MLNLQSFIRVNNSRLEHQLCSCLVDVDLTSIGHFLYELDQVDLVGRQAGIGVLGPDGLDDDLSA